MAYKFELPPELMQKLYFFREYYAQGPIVQQVRRAVQIYTQEKEREIGTTAEDAAQAIEKYREKESQLNS